MSSQVQIPIELLELIVENVDILSSQGRQSLVACSYANRALVSMCQKRIFRDVQLKQKLDRVVGSCIFTEARGADGDRLLELITTPQSRHLAAYVRNLTINVEDEFPYGSQLQKPKPDSTDPDFPIYAITPLLQNLKKFAVISPLLGPIYVEWDSLERRIRTFFSDIAQRLPEIDFRLFSDMLVSTFSNCPTLRELRISCVHTTKTLPSSRSRLKFLDFGYSSPNLPPNHILEHFDPTYSPFDITHLTALRLSSVNFLASDVDNILTLCANTLESLDLQVGQYANYRLSHSSRSVVSQSQATPPNLSSLHSLRSLTLRTEIYGYFEIGQEDMYDSNTPFIPAIIQTLPHKMHSPTFELVLDTFLSHFSTEHLATFPWSGIIGVLDDVRLSHILTVLRFRRYRRDPDDVNILNSELGEILDQNDDLRKLRQEGLLSYVSPWEED